METKIYYLIAIGVLLLLILFIRVIRRKVTNTSKPKKRNPKDDIIEFELVSNGMSGEMWIFHLKEIGYSIGDDAKKILLSDNFKPSEKGNLFKVIVFKNKYFKDGGGSYDSIVKSLLEHDLRIPTLEIICLIRNKFTDGELKKMGLKWIIAMHDPFKIEGRGLRLMCAGSGGSGKWLYTCSSSFDKFAITDPCGFAFCK